MTEKHCVPCEGGINAYAQSEVEEKLTNLNDWQYDADNKRLRKTFQFKGFLRTMSFVNAVAWMANQENHHPDLEVSYNTCTVNWQTHAAGGVTDNDFICAAKVDQLAGN